MSSESSGSRFRERIQIANQILNPVSDPTAALALLFVDKPAGVTTHSSVNPDEKKSSLGDAPDGFAEYLTTRAELKQSIDASYVVEPIFVVHRLDRETSGALCFARSRETAAVMQELFAQRKVEKTYLFLTDQVHAQKEFVRESLIERRGNVYVSIPADAFNKEVKPNSLTHFRHLKEVNGFHLWEARPETGRSHQIRLHAEDAKIPILGDSAHGGTGFPALCLHSQLISFTFGGQTYRSESPLPAWMSELHYLQDKRLCGWLTALDRRERLERSLIALGCDLTESALKTERLVHTEGGPLRVERLGSVYSLSWYRDQLPSEAEWHSLKQIFITKKWQHWYLQLRGNRGQTPNQERVLTSEDAPPVRWEAKEGQIGYEFRTDSGLSPGLFLDQRQNRLWVGKHARGLDVLNLFSYTGGFSVCAAAGGARKTVSVDVSKSFMEWTKTNFRLNSLSLEGHEFRAMDSRTYLSWAKKKGLKFDLVICDPPSFGRSVDGIFRIEKDFEALLESLIAVTGEKGQILFSSNFEQWSREDFLSRISRVLTQTKSLFSVAATPAPDWDFELPRTPRLMKSFLLKRS
jgi:23S rRNA (cytosine1962-C5)-methyltransferase